MAFFLVIFLVLFRLSLYGLYRPAVSINKVDIKGTLVIKPVDIERVVLDELSGKYLSIFPKKSIFIYPRKALLQRLKSEFKRIENIDIYIEGFTGLLVNLSERPERYLWCGRDLEEEQTSLKYCFFADSGGYIFSKSPYYSGNIFLEFYGPLFSGENANPIGGAILSEDKFNKLISFENSLGKIGFTPIKILVKPDEDYEIYLFGGGKILATGKNDLDKNIGYLKLAIATDPLKSKIEQSRATLDYLDLRFGNKVFYRFK